MIRELHVRGLAVLSDVYVELAPGLNVLTGETGAGKTLVVTSLRLLAGSRADARLIAQGAKEALVQAVFETPEQGELIVARRLAPDGRSRAWVDGRIVPSSQLAELCAPLVHVVGQGAGFELASGAAQLRSLDALAGNDQLLREYREALTRLRRCGTALEQLSAEERARQREMEFCRFQAEEIEGAGLTPGEEEALAGELSRLENSERLAEDAARVQALLSSEEASGALAEAWKVLESAARLDPQAQGLALRVAELVDSAQEVARDARHWAAGLEPDPVRLDQVRERSALLGALKRKYGETVEDILAAGRAARSKLAELESAEGREAGLQQEVATLEPAVREMAVALSERRHLAAQLLARRVNSELPALALPKAQFEVRCERREIPTENGTDVVEFRFSADRGGAPQPLGKVASGGELSRTMIAVTLALSGADEESSSEVTSATHGVDSVLVFDEADQGVGGRAALELASRLRRLGNRRQVIVVSHLPQIAAFASRHVCVRSGASGVRVEVLTGDDRLLEVSRMLAGLGESATARAHAAELIALGAESARREPGAA